MKLKRIIPIFLRFHSINLQYCAIFIVVTVGDCLGRCVCSYFELNRLLRKEEVAGYVAVET